MEGSRDILPLAHQAIKCRGGIGSCLGNDFDLMVFQGLANGVRHAHVSGISGTDDQDLRSGG